MNELANIDLPESLELIEASAFYKNSLTEIKIYINFKKINMYAFKKNNIRSVKFLKQ